MAGRELPRKRLRERVAERKAREAERPTTMWDHLLSSVTPGRKSAMDGERPKLSDVWRGYAHKGGYVLMILALILLLIQMLPLIRGEPMNTHWTAIVVLAVIFMVGRALIFIAKYV